MHQPLLPPPLSPGPEPIPHGPIISLLKFILGILNTMFAAISLLIIAAAIYMHYNPFLDDNDDQLHDFSTFIEGNSTTHRSWFITTVGATGTYNLLTVLLGMSGSNNYYNRRSLFMYVLMLTGLIIAEIAAFILVYTAAGGSDPDTHERTFPKDPSGWWPRVYDALQTNKDAVVLGSLILVGAQTIALLAASWLHSKYTTAHEAYLDEVEEYEARNTSYLRRAVVDQYATTHSSSRNAGQNTTATAWQQRLKTKYKVSPTQWQAVDIQAQQQQALLSDDSEA